MLRPAHFSFSSCARVRTCRALSTTPARAAFERAVGEPVLEDEDEDGGRGRRRRSAGKDAGPTVPTLNEWLKGEGAQFKEPRKPRNWLGGDVPFPLNKSFKPPAPLSDHLKNMIWLMHDADRVNHNARHIAAEMGLSIPRVEAILKLKYLEKGWEKEGKQLQTGFSTGMEQLLGVSFDKRARRAALRTAQSLDAAIAAQEAEIAAPARADTQAADAQSEAEGAEGIRARARYTRMYWEMVSEAGDADLESVVPRQLEQGREEVARAREAVRAAKDAPSVLLGVPESEVLAHLTPAELEAVRELPDEQKARHPRMRAKTVVKPSGSAAENRPTIKFTDVGGKFVDLDREEKRIKRAQRDKARRQG